MSVRNAMLALLAQRARHGYELRDAFEALVGGRAVWDLKSAQVYTTLARLEEAGLVVQSVTRRVGGPDQRVYGITDAGREELDGWYSSGVHPMHHRDEVFLKIALALGDEEARPETVIREQRKTLYRDLHELTARRNGCQRPRELAQAMLLDKAIMHIEADLRWLEMAEARLREMARHAVPELPERRRGRPRVRTEEAENDRDGR
ncbi:MAG: helix-turn-helix transcriptional regulator [Coriobacteriia bacterium]|nr:helix-turn-helix transcriptional regulator [Coriobacteriia bacterium]